MGRHPLGDRSYQISKMWDVHHEIVRLASCGAKQVDIAAILNVTPEMVSYTLNSSIVKRQLELLRSARDVESMDVAKRIQEIALVAVEKMATLVEQDENRAVQLSASKDILDRAGHGAVKKMQLDGRLMHFTPDDLEQIKARAQELARENKMLDENTVDVQTL